ncbi:hypothetical protein NDU88_008339 [Pleurodeles waltl]|uniref:Uncharacterized protein n=1 Tax=Pleurodeles waltl TaxID=8319 RepID=A0AAV7NXJ1_PLEWA|nr:hypothetical protein NDU88_008339 [Pleurodeles waltl]
MEAAGDAHSAVNTEKTLLTTRKQAPLSEQASTFVYLCPCDGPLLTGPSEEVERSDTAASNPEKEGVASNPLQLPGPTGQRQTFHTSEGLQERRIPAGKGRRAEEAGVMGGDDGRFVQSQETIQEPSGLGKLSESDPEGSPALPAAREVPPRSFQPRFRRSVARPGASYLRLRERQGWLRGGGKERRENAIKEGARGEIGE